MSIAWSRFAEIVRSHQRFLLVSHIRPDCDALGSELGMAAILRSLGKDVKIVNGQETPPNLAFIDPQRQIACLGRTIQAADLADREVLIVLDTSAWAQLGPMAEVVRSFQGKKVVIDHHVSEDDLGAEPFKDQRFDYDAAVVEHEQIARREQARQVTDVRVGEARPAAVENEQARRIAWLESRVRGPVTAPAEEPVAEPSADVPAKPSITERRHRVLRLAQRGQDAKQIAATLGMNYGEVELMIGLHTAAA